MATTKTTTRKSKQAKTAASKKATKAKVQSKKTTTTRRKTKQPTKEKMSAAKSKIAAAHKKSAVVPKKKAAAEKKTTEIIIPALRLETMELELVGLTSLITHKFSDKARKMIEDAQQGKAKNKKPPKNPKAEFEAALHVIEPPKGRKRGRYGFPAAGFKKAAVNAARFADGVKMTILRGSFHIVGDLIEILGPPPVMRTDMVRIGGFGKQVSDVRYRPEFHNWRVKLKIRYNRDAITPDRIAHLFNIAGFAIGIGEWRPDRDGTHGQFEVASG